MTKTAEDLEQRIARQIAENTRLQDFYRWQYDRKQDGLPSSHDNWKQAKARNEAEGRQLNEEARSNRRNKLEAEQAAREQESRRDVDDFLAEKKLRLKRQWLANNPDQRAEDFEKKAWIHLRENIIAERPTIALEARMAKLNKTAF